MKKYAFFALRVKMLQQGLTQSALADAAGISRATLSARLNGSQPWLSSEMDRVGKVLGIPRDEYGRLFFDDAGGVQC